MAKIKSFDVVTSKESEVQVNDSLFNLPENRGLVHFVLTTYMAKGRSKTAKVKTRAEVSGGGRKPWKQKGTGRARAGTNSSPVWVGGGVTFGPRNIKRGIKINKLVLRKGMFTALSDRTSNMIVLLNDVAVKNSLKKVKDFNAIGTKLEVIGKKILYVTTEVNERKSILDNIEKLTINSVFGLNIFDILNSEQIIFEEGALKQFEEIYKNA